ncbi:MAG: O-antigen ligase family protein [Planctomycetales bacterium]|nr:O-antigen ligase family protein [Planctomycetales bacterium]
MHTSSSASNELLQPIHLRAEVSRFGISRFVLFWIPVLVIAVAVFDNHGNLDHARNAIGLKRDYIDEVEASTSSRRSKQLTFISYGIIGVILLIRKKDAGRLQNSHASITVPAVALLVYLFCSMFWSDEPAATIKRSILAACIAVGSWGLGRTWTLNDICRAIIFVSGMLLLAGIAAEIKFGTFMSLSESDYRFSGILHPARTAFSCSLMAIAAFTLYRQEKKVLYVLIAIIAIAFTIATKARTGTGALVIASVWLWWRQFSTRGILLTIWASLLLLSCLLIHRGISGGGLNLDKLTRMGREQELADPSTMTGRLPIWEEALREFSGRPVLGFGYGAFWNTHRIRTFERHNGWAFTHAHSAYIESLLNLGAVGFGIGVVVIGATLNRCRKLKGSNSLAASMVTALLLFGMVSGVAESAFVDDGYELIVALIGIAYIAFRDLESDENRPENNLRLRGGFA